MSNRSSRRTRRLLNGLIVSSHDETLALAEATLLLGSRERREWLHGRSLRRSSFRRDLEAQVIALGGTPADGASWAARGRSLLRRLQRVMAGTHEGDAYGACARAAEQSVLGYAVTLQRQLPDDVRFGLERHYVEIEADRIELRRLRWGAEPAALFAPPVTPAEVESVNTRNWDAENQERAPEATVPAFVQ